MTAPIRAFRRPTRSVSVPIGERADHHADEADRDDERRPGAAERPLLRLLQHGHDRADTTRSKPSSRTAIQHSGATHPAARAAVPSVLLGAGVAATDPPRCRELVLRTPSIARCASRCEATGDPPAPRVRPAARIAAWRPGRDEASVGGPWARFDDLPGRHRPRLRPAVARARRPDPGRRRAGAGRGRAGDGAGLVGVRLRRLRGGRRPGPALGRRTRAGRTTGCRSPCSRLTGAPAEVPPVRPPVGTARDYRLGPWERGLDRVGPPRRRPPREGPHRGRGHLSAQPDRPDARPTVSATWSSCTPTSPGPSAARTRPTSTSAATSWPAPAPSCSSTGRPTALLTRPMKGTAAARATRPRTTTRRAGLRRQREGARREPDDRRPAAQRPGPRSPSVGHASTCPPCSRRALRDGVADDLDVTAAPAAGTGLVDIFRALFPSRLGDRRPKTATMELIRELEASRAACTAARSASWRPPGSRSVPGSTSPSAR